jgi:hypothetical protein
MRTFAVALALLVATAGAATAAGQQRCSRDSFPVGGRSLTVTVCAAAAQGQRLDVSEAFARDGRSFSRTTAIDVVPGAQVSRAADDVSLAPLGLSSLLHLTLAYREGTVTIEHALLSPGAVPLK